MQFDDLLEIPHPVVSPNMVKITKAESIDALWEYYIKPFELAFREAMAEYEVEKAEYDKAFPEDPETDLTDEMKTVIENLTEPVKPQLPDQMLMLMGILRSIKAGLDPEGSGWAPLRDASKKAREELRREREGDLGSTADRVRELVGDINDSDPYVEGVRDAWGVAMDAELREIVETNDPNSPSKD
jgi:hypothetical protein